jgi:four helix bundle protein
MGAHRTRFRFEKLTVWQQARSLTRAVYDATGAFPKHELFGLTGQLRRAAISAAANIAEGSGRNSDKDFAHFLEQSYGSVMEIACLVFLALDQSLISESTAEKLLDSSNQLAAQLVALNRSMRVSTSKTPFPPRPSGSRLSTLDPRLP